MDQHEQSQRGRSSGVTSLTSAGLPPYHRGSTGRSSATAANLPPTGQHQMQHPSAVISTSGAPRGVERSTTSTSHVRELSQNRLLHSRPQQMINLVGDVATTSSAPRGDHNLRHQSNVGIIGSNGTAQHHPGAGIITSFNTSTSVAASNASTASAINEEQRERWCQQMGLLDQHNIDAMRFNAQKEFLLQQAALGGTKTSSSKSSQYQVLLTTLLTKMNRRTREIRQARANRRKHASGLGVPNGSGNNNLLNNLGFHRQQRPTSSTPGSAMKGKRSQELVWERETYFREIEKKIRKLNLPIEQVLPVELIDSIEVVDVEPEQAAGSVSGATVGA
ncbi:unnamed protein product, partial [Amoebophrya sp. A120]|eukprot:GSA120T00016525001.1